MDQLLLDPRAAHDDDGICVVPTSTFVGSDFTKDIAEGYERLAEFHSPEAFETMKAQLGVWLAPIADRNRLAVLEIGCGTGYLTSALLDLSLDLDTFVVNDISLAMLERCREVLAESGRDLRAVEFLAADAGEHLFKDSQFDAIVASSVLHHILDWQAFLSEVHRILRPGGVFAVSEPLGRSYRFVAFVLQLHVWERAIQGQELPTETSALVNSYCDNVLARSGQAWDDTVLAGLDDKHLFVEADTIDFARSIGFASAQWLASDPSAESSVADLVTEIALGLRIDLSPLNSPSIQLLDRLVPGVISHEFPVTKTLQLIR